MARVTAETVDSIARLAHLSLSDEERETFAPQLEGILTYAESIQALDAEDVAPVSPAGARPVFREDLPRPGLERERVLAEAPDPAQGLFRVPRILS